LILTIGDQDLSNIGYFRSYPDDLEYLPLTLRLNDLRARGKSVALGEYGVKTHPAWTVENGAGGYHVQRTEEQQKELFMAVACYGLAMGASKVQNWCLRDASERCFPWGVFYPNGRVPKDVAYWHRNLSLVWRFLRPKYVAPEVTVLQPDSLRLGAQSHLALNAAFNSFRALLAMSVNFNVLNEENVDKLTTQTKVLIWPTPYCPDDAAYQRVLQWVQQGGKLLVTGDLSFNWDRKRSRTERLKELCGVEFVKELAPPGQRGPGAQSRPCIEVRPTTAEAAGPSTYRNRVGKGEVVYCADPLELGTPEDTLSALKALYPVKSDYADRRGFHVLDQPLAGGGVFHMEYPLSPQAGDAIRIPAFMVVGGGGEVLAVGSRAGRPAPGSTWRSGDAVTMCLSLDRKSLPASSAVLLAPLSAGYVDLATGRQWKEPVLVLGDIQAGKWKTFETRAGVPKITLDEDTMTCLLLACEKTEVGKWVELIEKAATRPWEVEGY
ncbi:MAG: hypothetical protein KKI08_18920, partial [Armatimonadetes bacterium]|nr:hypothetical protein [Armatimonadota bacterium]